MAESYINITEYLAVLRKKELMPQVMTLHESIEAFHASSEHHPESERAEKTLNVHQFQQVLHVLLADKKLVSLGERGTLDGLASLASVELSTREQLMAVMSPARRRSRSRQRMMMGEDGRRLERGTQVGERESKRGRER